jgi:hypothetical protein
VCVALVIHHANRMRCIILSSVACRAVLYFSTLSHKEYDFRRKLLKIKSRFDFFTTLSETFLILRRICLNINLYRFLCRRYSCYVLLELGFPPRIFDKSSKIRIHENPSSGRRVVQRGRTD